MAATIAPPKGPRTGEIAGFGKTGGRMNADMLYGRDAECARIDELLGRRA